MVAARKGFLGQESGSVLLEALLTLPVITLFTIGILEFGNILWQREQVQTGVRDAARYWSRCAPESGSYTSVCSEDTARNIAFYGTPNPVAGVTPRRVPGWGSESQLIILPEKDDLPAYPEADDVVYVKAETVYQGSPLFRLLNIGPVTIAYSYRERYIGW